MPKTLFTDNTMMVIQMAPRKARNMSFWASQISPCVPRKAAPCAGKNTSATAHSINSYKVLNERVISIGKSHEVYEGNRKPT